MTSCDAELLRRMLAGDEEAFTTIYRSHQGRIYRFALLMSGSEAIAEDVTQDVFMALMRQAERYDASRGSLASYLYGIARNYVLRRVDRDQSYVPIVEASDENGMVPLTLIAQSDPLDDLARNEVIRSVRQAVLALPARYREVVVLCHFQELSYAEAAIVLSRPVGTVCSRLHRGHALLIEKLRSSGKIDSQAHGTRSVRSFA